MNFRGGGKKSNPKSGFSQAARPLAGAEVLMAVGGPSPPRGRRGKKKPKLSRKIVTKSKLKFLTKSEVRLLSIKRDEFKRLLGSLESMLLEKANAYM